MLHLCADRHVLVANAALKHSGRNGNRRNNIPRKHRLHLTLLRAHGSGVLLNAYSIQMKFRRHVSCFVSVFFNPRTQVNESKRRARPRVSFASEKRLNL